MIDGDDVVDVSGTSGHRLEHGTISPIRALLSLPGAVSDNIGPLVGERTPLAAVRLAPIVPDPPKIIAAPVNYRDHQAEMQEDYHIDALGIFLKATSSVLESGGTVRLPYSGRRFDQEGELAVVIGQRASHVTVTEAFDYIAGYTMLLDMTMLGGEDRSTRKSFDTFTPVGPYLVTADEVGAPDSMRLRTWVNDELRQDADVSDLIWNVPRLIAYASSVMTLQPGDIITTGTPAGIGRIFDGDRIALEITNLGKLEVTISDKGAVMCPTRGAQRGPKPPETITPVRAQDWRDTQALGGLMTIIERVATVIMLVPAAIWAGIVAFYVVERVNLWARMPVDQFAVDFRRSINRADPLQPILAITSIIGSVIFAVSTGGLASAFAWIGAGLIAVVIVMSIAFPEKINSQFRRRAEGELPPQTEKLRRNWRLWHWIRTGPTVAALVSLVLATTFA